MIKIQHFEQSIMFTSQLPVEMTFSTYEFSEQVTVLLNDQAIFNTRVYVDHSTTQSNSQTISAATGHFYDFRSIIEDYMKSSKMTIATFQIKVSSSAEQDTTTKSTIIYNRNKMPKTASTYCSSHFLTNRKSFLINRKDAIMLSYIQTSSEQVETYIEYFVLPNNGKSIQKYQSKHTTETATSPTLKSYSTTIKACEDDLKNRLRIYGKLLACTIHCGSRSITAYCTDQPTALAIRFRNAFNVQEWANLQGATSTKTEVDQSEATCLGAATFYDQVINQSNTFESTFITPSEAIWLNELLISPEVIISRQGYEQEEILITDMTSEITNSNSEENHIKFTWKYKRDPLHVSP